MAQVSVVNSFGVGESYQYFTNVGPGTSQTQSSVTGTWVSLGTVTVPQGFFLEGDVVTIEACCTKLGTTDNWYLGMFCNTSASLNGSLLIGFCMNNKPNNSSLTYSIIQRRLHILTNDGTGEGTYVWDYDREYTGGGTSSYGFLTHDQYAFADFRYKRIGATGSYSTTTGLMSGVSLASPAWGINNTVIIIAGYTDNPTSSPIRFEWIKVSGKSQGDGSVTG
jgi:hypothetical protein